MKKGFCLLLLLLLGMMTAMVFAEQSGAEEELFSASGYVYVEADGQYRWYPLASGSEESYPVRVTQQDQDGQPLVNVIRITQEGVIMESSNCENQDCVNEGIVTLANREMRALANYLICLPHQLVVQLYSPEEFRGWYDMMKAAQPE